MQTALQRLFGRLPGAAAAAGRSPAGTLQKEGCSLTLINAHGRFNAKACQLQAADSGPAQALAQITLRQLEPYVVALQRVLRRLPLTAGQLGVCAALYGGCSPGDIAHSQGIARSTVIDHMRKIYRELNVGSAWELRQRVDEEMHR